MANLASISRKELSDKVKSAVDQAIRHPRLRGLQPEGAVVIPPWLIGFILRDAELKERGLADVLSVAAEVASAAGGAGAQPAFYHQGGHVIMGFFPENPVNLIKE